jgi:electron transport complex protein RnfB
VTPSAPRPEELASRILDVLPQTQCTRCGFADCTEYAQAIGLGQADINQCPPGGMEGVQRIAKVCGLPAKSLNPVFGNESPRNTVYIDEDWCIGCTLCIAACPTDAIVGSNKRMHTVMEKYCTGCELCLPVCPVDCIIVENASAEATAWAAWSPAQAQLARERYTFKTARREREAERQTCEMQALAQIKLANLAAHSKITDPEVLARKKAIIEAAMKLARAKTPVNRRER